MSERAFFVLPLPLSSNATTSGFFLLIVRWFIVAFIDQRSLVLAFFPLKVGFLSETFA